jgi:hypothetical protein
MPHSTSSAGGAVSWSNTKAGTGANAACSATEWEGAAYAEIRACVSAMAAIKYI